MTLRHRDEIVHLSDLLARFQAAFDLMWQITQEAERVPNWVHLQSRVNLLEARVGALCEATQLAAFQQRYGYVVDLPRPRRSRVAPRPVGAVGTLARAGAR